MKKLLSALVVFIMVLQAFVSCSKKESTTSPDVAKGQKTAKDYKIVLLLPGQVNDQGWNASNYSGVVECNAKLGTNMEFVESVQPQDFESAFREYGEKGYDIVMAAGSQFDEACTRIAPLYPNTRYMIVNGAAATTSNMSPLFPKEYEASYLAGIIAGFLTKTGKFGLIGGEENQAMVNLMAVYGKTAVEIAKNRGIKDASYNLAYANSWSDIAKGKQMGENMIRNGADVMFAYANELGLGVINAAMENGKYHVGYAADQTKIDPKTVVASIDFKFANMYLWAIDSFIKGNLPGGKMYEVGIKEDLFAPIWTNNVTDEIKNAVNKAMDDCKQGKVDLKNLF